MLTTRHDAEKRGPGQEGTVLCCLLEDTGRGWSITIEISLRTVTQTSPNPTSFANALNGVLVCGGKSFI